MWDACIAELAGRQFNRVSREQLTALGLSRHAIAHRLHAGRLAIVEEGVFAVPPVREDDDWGRWMGATLTAPGSVLSHVSAAAAWGFWSRRREFEVVTRPGSGGPRRHGGVLVCRSSTLDGDCELLRGIPITSVCRTLFDVAPHSSDRAVARAVRDAVRLRLMADGYFVAPYTVANYLGGTTLPAVPETHGAIAEARAAAQDRIDRVLKVRGTRTVREFHRAIGAICWDHVGMTRNDAGLRTALASIQTLRDEFWQDVVVPGEPNNLNPNLDYAGRVADYMEFAELMALDALHRTESCGGHFREEFQTPDGEALRDDERFTYAAAWQFNGVGQAPALHTEPLVFEEVHPTQRSYK